MISLHMEKDVSPSEVRAALDERTEEMGEWEVVDRKNANRRTSVKMEVTRKEVRDFLASAE